MCLVLENLLYILYNKALKPEFQVDNIVDGYFLKILK